MTVIIPTTPLTLLLAPFVARAHELGFKVMLHVNYFGVDPLMPDYTDFQAQQFRHKYNGELQWWLWERADPVIKFAYINPASTKWRDFFTQKMTDLVKQTGVDALHLDQTLCIFNDKNGLYEGQNSAQGSLLLHKQLKEAMPEVAISGEGLDEVTFVHEAFAQRHVYGIDHSYGRFDPEQVRLAHPVCAFLFNERTQPYQYLGTTNPTSDQLYMAWRDAYTNWGVIPGISWPSKTQLLSPVGTSRQAMEEVLMFQRNRLTADMDGPWPERIRFPYRTADGDRMAYVTDRGWTLNHLNGDGTIGEELLRTITGQKTIELPGSIEGWFCYDSARLLGLQPDIYYVYDKNPRSLSVFHMVPLDEDAGLDGYSDQGGLLMVRSRVKPAYNLIQLLPSAEMYIYRRDGTRQPFDWESAANSGAGLQGQGVELFIHPPYKEAWPDPMPTGQAGLTCFSYELDLPADSQPRFESTVHLRGGAEEKSDGILFTVTATAGGKALTNQLLADSVEAQPFNLDLTEFEGQKVKLEITASAGPAGDASFDWGLMGTPQVIFGEGPIQQWKVTLPANLRYLVAPEYRQLTGSASEEVIELRAGAALMATEQPPQPLSASANLLELTGIDQLQAEGGRLTTGDTPGPGIELCTVDGVSRPAFFAHPPDKGSRLKHFILDLSAASRATLSGYVGMRDGSEKSEGVRFEVLANGNRVWSQAVRPGFGWVPFEVDLTDFVSTPVVLTLLTNSEGSYYYDWAAWGEPTLTLTR